MTKEQDIEKDKHDKAAARLMQGGGTIYFIGIGGIGMSALARYFNSRGANVSGYDRTATPLTQQLEDLGIAIHYTEDINLIPKDADAVVYTPAVPANHQELVYYQEHHYTVVKRSDVLQWITANSFNICVAGTHGKTTITTMIGHLLRHSGYGCNAFLGGISANYNTNFWSHENNTVVVEADEYDRSFLKLVPDVAIISAMDPDHLDIYGTPEAMEDAFIQFSGKVKSGGCLIAKWGMPRGNELKSDTLYTYSLDNNEADVYAESIRIANGGYTYNIIHKNWQIHDVVLPMGGLHNLENSIAAITVAKHLDIDNQKIKDAVASFKGVKRRFEYVIKNDEQVLIDDYAHHPEELRALITGVRSLYGDQKCTVVFQPHLFSRTKDFYKAFGESLSLADEVILLPIYPAREQPQPGVTSELIFHQVTIDNKRILSKEMLLQVVDGERPKLLVMCGAGDIDAMVQPVQNILLNA